MTKYEALKLAIARKVGLQKKLKAERKNENKLLSETYKLMKYLSVYHTTGELVPLTLVRKTQKIIKRITQLEQRIESNKWKIVMLNIDLEELESEYQEARKTKGE